MEGIKNQIRKKVIIRNVVSKNKGGQSCGFPNMQVELISEDLDLHIKIGFHKSSLKNKELLNTIFELLLDDLIK